MVHNYFSKGAIPFVQKTCVIIAGLFVVWLLGACEKPKEPNSINEDPITISGENAGKLQYIKTELGGCNLKSQQDSNTEIQDDTVIVTFVGDSVHVFVGLNYICKELSFETRFEIIDGILTMYLIDSGGEYYRCMCYYTFNFVFTYNEVINQEYKIVLINPQEENQIIVSEGFIANNNITLKRFNHEKKYFYFSHNFYNNYRFIFPKSKINGRAS